MCIMCVLCFACTIEMYDCTTVRLGTMYCKCTTNFTKKNYLFFIIKKQLIVRKTIMINIWGDFFFPGEKEMDK